jgi:mono/diheme cytochrome c family protein
MWRIFAVTALVFVHVPSASAAGNAEAGRLLTEKWCAGCHATPSAKTASDAAPAFLSVAKAHKGDPLWVRAWLNAPHPAMPSMGLTREQIEDVTAYLQSLPSN